MPTTQNTVVNSVFRRKREPVVTFTQMIAPADAARMLETMKYEHQRPYRLKRAQAYADEMSAGAFRELTQIFIAIYRGRHIILDGQHRLNAVILSSVPVLFTVVEKDVDTEEELAQLYSTTDVGIRRTPGDIYGAHALGEEFGLSRSMLDYFGAGIKFMMSGCMRVGEQMRADAVIPHMRTYAPYMQDYYTMLLDSVVSTTVFSQCRRSSTVAAALLTLKFAAPKADREGRPSVREFWLGTLKDDGLRQGDPRKAAYQHLSQSRTQASRATRQNFVVRQRYSVHYLGNCFNAYIRGESLKYAKVMDESAPLNIYGVPSNPALWW